MHRLSRPICWIACLTLLTLLLPSVSVAETPKFKLARFTVDVTIPMGHRCMGLLPTKSKKILDPLFTHGFVLLGSGKPMVVCAVDWCEIRNGAYDQWRNALAKAAGTTHERVLVTSLHQHDAPVTDLGAAKLLEKQGLKGELYDEAFHDHTVARVAEALKDSLEDATPITHLGLGQAKVEKIASNRRIVYPNGAVSFGRYSRSGGNKALSEAPEGLIDPFLKTISFWNGDKPVLALHAYSTHPMSHYGRGEVSADFVGLARDRRQRDDFSVHQIYVSGCSGDVTAGKYNNGSTATRVILIDRLYQAMKAAWKNTKKVPLREIAFRNTKFDLEYHPNPNLTEKALTATLADKSQKVEKRIWAAMGLSSRHRVASGQKIDMPCIDFGDAQIVLQPGEAFVGYQLMAQKMRPDSFVMSIGYGECWPGYVPTASCFAENFRDTWLWVGPGSEKRMRAALEQVLLPK